MDSNTGRYKARQELRLGGPLVRYRIKASPKYQLLVSLVAANVVTVVAGKLNRVDSNTGSYKARQELILGGALVRYRIKASPK